MCVDLVTDVLGAGDERAHVEAARAVADACRGDGGDKELLDEMQARLESYPLGTTRWRWLDAIGVDVACAASEDAQSTGSEARTATSGSRTVETCRLLKGRPS